MFFISSTYGVTDGTYCTYHMQLLFECRRRTTNYVSLGVKDRVLQQIYSYSTTKYAVYLAAVICYSQKVRSTCTFFLRYLYAASSRNSFVFECFEFFRSSYLLGGVFVVLSYPVRWHFICLP